MGSSNDSATTGADSIKSSSFTRASVVDTIPAEFPLVQYVAECCRQLQQRQHHQQQQELSPPTRPCQQQPPLDDIESRLFFKCVELEKWALAHTLAAKMQRNLAVGCAVRQTRQRQQDDEVLQFLDTCAS